MATIHRHKYFVVLAAAIAVVVASNYLADQKPLLNEWELSLAGFCAVLYALGDIRRLIEGRNQ